MNFEEALRHVREGSATDEERAYVMAQIDFMNKFLGDDQKMPSAPIAEANREEVKQAKKKFKWRYVVIPVVTIVLIIVAIGAILGGVFGSAAFYAKDAMKFGKGSSVEVARQYALNDAAARGYTFASANDLMRGDVKRDFEYNDSNLKNSYYTYYIELKGYAKDANNRYVELEYEIRVDTRNGNANIVEFDIDRD